MPPILEATTNCAMYAFGNHLRVSSGEEHLTTRDSGIDSKELVHITKAPKRVWDECNWKSASM